MEKQDRINLILQHKNFNEYLQNNIKCEKDRLFCLHDINHFLDVARIAYIIILEEGLSYSKDVVYAIALLHDIGKWQGYLHNIPHELASVDLSKEILIDAGFKDDEIEIITCAIKNHRNKNAQNTLDSVIYKSDKLSRKCFNCQAINQCNWKEEKKNYYIKY